MENHNDKSHAARSTRQSNHKGTKAGSDAGADALRDTSKGHGAKGHGESRNPSEQGDTAGIRQNTTNAGFFQGRRVK